MLKPDQVKQQKWHKLNENMRITGADQISSLTQPDVHRKLVIMMTPLLAKAKHTQKYVDLYTCRGFDVLTVSLKPVQFLFPVIGSHRVRDNILTFLTSNSSLYSNYLIHGCSVGAYLSSELLATLRTKETNELNEIKAKIVGSVYDSIVDPEYTPYSFARSVVKSQFVANLLQLTIKAYLKLTHSFAAIHYQFATESFFMTPVKTPALIFASKNDALSNPEIVDKIKKTWESKAIQVTVKMWPNSQHAGHLYAHPDEYEQTLDHFIKSLKMN